MTKIVHLSWISHQKAFSTIIPNFRVNNIFCDVTVSCNGNYFPAHRLILSTFSDYFKEILEKVPCRHPYIVIQDVEVKDLKDLLDFIYVGEASVESHRMASFLKAASNLKIRGLGLSNDSDSSFLKFQNKIIKLHEEVEENEAISLCSPENKASSSGEKDISSEVKEASSEVCESSPVVNEEISPCTKRSRGRPKSKRTAKRKLLEESPKIIQKEQKQMKMEDTKTTNVQIQTAKDSNIKDILKTSRVVIENCPEAIKLCKTLNGKSKKGANVDQNGGTAATTADSNGNDDFDSVNFCESVNSESVVDMNRSIKEEPLDYGMQTDCEKSEGSIFSIENVFSVKDKPGPSSLSPSGQPTQGSSLYWTSNQELQTSQLPVSRNEQEFFNQSEAKERETHEEYFRVKIEPMDDICEFDNSKNEANAESSEDHFGESVYDFLTTELGADSQPDGTSTPSPITLKLTKETNSQADHLNDGITTSKKSKLKRKMFTCAVCLYKTGFQQNLKVHMRTHTGEKPYTCTLCDYKATQKNSLDKHMQTHAEKKVLNCKNCSYETKRSNEMEEHMKTHLETVVYKCEFCSFYTSRNLSLRNHVKKHLTLEENALDSDNSFEPKKKLLKRKKIGPYKSRKMSLLRRKMIALRKMENAKKTILESAIKKQHMIIEGGVSPMIVNNGDKMPQLPEPGNEAIHLNMKGIKEIPSVPETSGLVVESTKRKYKKRTKVVVEETFTTSSVSNEISVEGNACRTIREKKLLALNLIKQNLDVSEPTSENSMDGSESYEQRKRKGKSKNTIIAVKKKITQTVQNRPYLSGIKSRSRLFGSFNKVLGSTSFSTPVLLGSQSNQSTPMILSTQSVNTPMVSVSQSITGPLTANIVNSSSNMVRTSASRMVQGTATVSLPVSGTVSIPISRTKMLPIFKIVPLSPTPRNISSNMVKDLKTNITTNMVPTTSTSRHTSSTLQRNMVSFIPRNMASTIPGNMVQGIPSNIVSTIPSSIVSTLPFVSNSSLKPAYVMREAKIVSPHVQHIHEYSHEERNVPLHHEHKVPPLRIVSVESLCEAPSVSKSSESSPDSDISVIREISNVSTAQSAADSFAIYNVSEIHEDYDNISVPDIPVSLVSDVSFTDNAPAVSNISAFQNISLQDVCTSSSDPAQDRYKNVLAENCQESITVSEAINIFD